MLPRLLIIALFVFAANASAQVPAGATKQAVIEQLGWPKSASGSANREILNYADYSVLLVNGLVTKLELKPKDAKRPMAYSPPAPKNAPGSVSQNRPPAPSVAPASTLGGGGTQSLWPVEPPNQRAPAIVPRPAAVSASWPPPAPPDIFAPAKTVILWMMLAFGALAAIKLWFRAHLKRNRKKFEDLFHSSHAPAPEPALRVPGRGKPAGPNPDPSGWSLALLKKIEWHRFEQLVAAYERQLGNEAELTGFGPDGGVDVNVFAEGSRTRKRVIQCKAFDNQKIGIELVRAFYGVMSLQKVPEGVFYTTSSFTDDALAIARENDNLTLIDGPAFLDRIRQLSPDRQQKLLEIATEGDYTTPTCASCGIKMIFRTPENARSFWGCINFPRGCKNKLYVVRAC